MPKLIVKYFVPYTSGNGTYEASTLAEAEKLWAADHKTRGYMIEDRHIKSTLWDGKKVPAIQG